MKNFNMFSVPQSDRSFVLKTYQNSGRKINENQDDECDSPKIITGQYDINHRKVPTKETASFIENRNFDSINNE